MSENPLAALRAAAQGLLFPSETDAPLEAFFWPEARPSATDLPGAVARNAGLDGSALKTRTLAAFFKPATASAPWQNEKEKAEAARWQSFVAYLKSALGSPAVFVSGGAKKTVYIAGLVDGGYAGWKTTIVET